MCLAAALAGVAFLQVGVGAREPVPHYNQKGELLRPWTIENGYSSQPATA